MNRSACAVCAAFWATFFFALPGPTLSAGAAMPPTKRIAPAPPPSLSEPATGVDAAVIKAYLAEQAMLTQQLESTMQKKAVLVNSLAAAKEEESTAVAKAAEAKKVASQARYDECTKRQQACVQSCDQADGSRRIGSALSSLSGGSASTAAGIAMLDSLAAAKSCKENCEATSCGSP